MYENSMPTNFLFSVSQMIFQLFFLWLMYAEMSQFIQGLISHQSKMGPVPMLRKAEFWAGWWEWLGWVGVVGKNKQTK